MKNILFSFILLASCGCCSTASADYTRRGQIPEMINTNIDSHPRYVTVSGTGSVAVSPDMVTIDLSVSNTNESVREAVKNNAEEMKKVMMALTGRFSIKNDDLCTHNFNVSPVYERDKHGNNVSVKGYTVQNGLIITLRDINKTGDILSAITNNTTTINQVHFVVSDSLRDSVLNQARELAVKDAKARASLYVKTAGATIGDVQAIVEQGLHVPQYSNTRVGFAATAESVPVAAGKTSVSVSVSVSFAIR